VFLKGDIWDILFNGLYVGLLGDKLFLFNIPLVSLYLGLLGDYIGLVGLKFELLIIL